MVPGSDVSPSHKMKSFSKTKILSSNPKELCDRIKLVLQEKKVGNSSDIVNEKIIAIVDKLLECE